MIRGSLLLLCAIGAGACSNMLDETTTLTGGPTGVSPLEAPCEIAAPTEFAVEPRNANAYISWAGIEAALLYEVEIYDVRSEELVASHALPGTRWEWGAHGQGQGPYRARARAVTSCGVSDWSAEDVFILNRFGHSAGTPEPPAAVAAPILPTPEASAPPAATVAIAPAPAACGSLSGVYAVNYRGVTFKPGMTATRAVAIPAGNYLVEVETYDAQHRAGYQSDQTEETLNVSVRLAEGGGSQIGATADIPEAATTARASFHVSVGRVTHVTLASAGRHSVHGACVVWRPV
jgi:hypothetical protein